MAPPHGPALWRVRDCAAQRPPGLAAVRTRAATRAYLATRPDPSDSVDRTGGGFRGRQCSRSRSPEATGPQRLVGHRQHLGALRDAQGIFSLGIRRSPGPPRQLDARTLRCPSLFRIRRKRGELERRSEPPRRRRSVRPYTWLLTHQGISVSLNSTSLSTTSGCVPAHIFHWTSGFIGKLRPLVSWARQAQLPAEHRHGSVGRSSPAVKRLYEVSPAETVWGHSTAIPSRRSLQGPSTALGGHPMERCSTLSCGLKGGARPLKG